MKKHMKLTTSINITVNAVVVAPVNPEEVDQITADNIASDFREDLLNSLRDDSGTFDVTAECTEFKLEEV